MSVFQIDLYGELLIRFLFWVAFGFAIVKPLKPSYIERKFYFLIVFEFIVAKWLIIQASNPPNEELKNFILGIGIFGNIVGYFSLIIFLQSIFKIKNHFKKGALPTN